jgi:hypothetical protein
MVVEDQEKPMNKRILAVVIALALLALAVGGWYYWRSRQAPAPVAAVPEPAAPQPVTPASAPEPVPAIQHPVAEAPVEAPAGPAPLPSLDGSDSVLKAALTELMGTKAVVTMLLTDGFVRRVVATVDNLGRSHASPALWPVQPMAGRFSVERNANGEGEVISAANQARYSTFVRVIESVDMARAAKVYLRLYPLFQQAYEELGYPRGYFNDRLVTVIDLMLAAPTPSTPVRVKLTEVKGPIPSERPWVRYEFADPVLEEMPAGAKILARIGQEPARRLKAQLAAFRRAIVK